jgi:hypothetical protein
MNKPVDKVKPLKFTFKELSGYIPTDQISNSKQIILEALKLYYNQKA